MFAPNLYALHKTGILPARESIEKITFFLKSMISRAFYRVVGLFSRAYLLKIRSHFGGNSVSPVPPFYCSGSMKIRKRLIASS